MSELLIEELYPTNFGDLLLAAIRDYFADPRYTPPEYLYEYQLVGNTEETQGALKVAQPAKQKVWIERSYNPEQERYPIIIINPSISDEREVSLGRFLGFVEDENHRYKLYGSMSSVTVRIVVVSLHSPEVAGRIKDHLRKGLCGPIKEALASANIIVRNVNPILTTAVMDAEPNWRGKIPRYLYSFDVAFQTLWKEKVECDLEYLVNFEGKVYLVRYGKITVPIGKGNLEEFEKKHSSIFVWREDIKDWEIVGEGEERDKVWEVFRDQLSKGNLKPNLVKVPVTVDSREGSGGVSYGTPEDDENNEGVEVFYEYL